MRFRPAMTAAKGSSEVRAAKARQPAGSRAATFASSDGMPSNAVAAKAPKNRVAAVSPFPITWTIPQIAKAQSIGWRVIRTIPRGSSAERGALSDGGRVPRHHASREEDEGQEHEGDEEPRQGAGRAPDHRRRRVLPRQHQQRDRDDGAEGEGDAEPPLPHPADHRAAQRGPRDADVEPDPEEGGEEEGDHAWQGAPRAAGSHAGTGATTAPRSARPPGPVIRMPRMDAGRPVQRLRQQPADEHVRPGEPPEGEAMLRAGEYRGVQSLGTADQERERPRRLGPAREERGQALAVRRLAAEVEGDGDRVGRERREDRGALPPADLGRAARTLRQLAQRERRAEAGVEALEQVALGPRARPSDGEERGRPQRRPGAPGSCPRGRSVPVARSSSSAASSA
jgi:hypothetical protein